MAKMKYDELASILSLIVIASIIAMFVGTGYLFKSASCDWRWSGAYETSYSMFGGCKVVIDGKTIPEANVRQL